GNFEPIARLKLKRAGIGRWFAGGPGGFGSDSEDRAVLPTIARRRAGKVARDNAIVIGDTPRDIACARADGVRCVAVTTGQYGPDELAGADAVARDAAELRASLEQLGV
ncbi:MAG TPA: HAD hydrolase-like protein, partial [Solirubrobacteraceae bacterium]|nr:HAD hydrolase-like protein [Solirubrobacteraceae bacterium]